MSESALKVFHELTAAGLLASDAATRYSVEIESGVDALLDKLVKEEIITTYQCDKFRKGQVSDICFGDYIVIKELGRGGMGTVLLARHRVMDRNVAIKVLPVTALESESAVARFYQEVKVAGRLTHNNIVHAYDAREHQGFHYLVMEYVDGHDLSEVVHEIGPLPLSLAVDYITQAALGLEYAHGENVVHRDIKPSNLLLDKQGVVKVLDMGLARVGIGGVDEQSLHLTTTGQVMGTVEFMSPEQAEDTRLADVRSDIYSLGCTLYRLLSTRGPYSRDTVVKTILAHRGDPIPELPCVHEPAHGRAQKIFEKMVAKKPDDRYQNVSELLEDLESIDDPNVSENFAQTVAAAPSNQDVPVPVAPTAPPVTSNLRAPVIPIDNFADSANIPRTAIAVRISDEVADSAVDAYKKEYDSRISNPESPSITILDLSDNSQAHLAAGSADQQVRANSGVHTNVASQSNDELFYIGEAQDNRSLFWLIASAIAAMLSFVPIFGIIVSVIMFVLTRRVVARQEKSEKQPAKYAKYAKRISIMAIVVSCIVTISVLAS